MLLGLMLSEKPLNTRGLYAVVRANISTTNFATIFKTLDRLMKDGYVNMIRLGWQKKYVITSAGIAYLYGFSGRLEKQGLELFNKLNSNK